VVIVSTYPPRRCGLATFTEDLRAALHEFAPQWSVQVCAIDRDGLTYGPEVIEVIGQDSPGDYRRAARVLATRADLVVVQHEYGIFGGKDGSYILELADELTAHCVPYVVTLHTVLSEPSRGQAETLAGLCRGAARVTGFTDTARRLAEHTGIAARDRFAVVPHGAPALLREPVDPAALRPVVAAMLSSLGDGRVLSTFGLIGPSKGLEVAIAALPAVAARYPDVRYVVAGATHPELLRAGGGSYPARLARLADRLGVAEHARFVDLFLTESELAALLARTDLYLTPYRSPDQICSGALTFALAAGCPVVSTRYRYAVDLVTPPAGPARGLLVPFDDPQAFGEAVATLLGDPARLARVHAAALGAGESLTWPSVAARFAAVFTEAAAVNRVATRHRPLVTAGVHRLRLAHLAALVDEIGIIQFTRDQLPDPDSGYCVDDAARLAIVANGLTRGPDTRPARWLASALRLLAAALAPGGMHNQLGYDGRWRDEPHLGDHVGRAIWALGVVAAGSSQARDPARRLLMAAIRLVPALSAPRSRAYAVLGLSQLDRPPEGLLDAAAGALVSMASRRPGWDWFEDRLTYDNARLPQALLAAGGRLDDQSMVDRGLSTLDWYLGRVFPDGGQHLRLIGNDWSDENRGDEQPIDAAAIVEALLEARQLTRSRHYADLAGRAFAWFHGHNRARIPLYDTSTGGCRDGLSTTTVNRNQGAESTLAYYQALLAMADAGLIRVLGLAGTAQQPPRQRAGG
jgi:glycosyltransferase involved in cell wall biosynthesis